MCSPSVTKGTVKLSIHCTEVLQGGLLCFPWSITQTRFIIPSLFIKHKANEDIKIVTFYSSSFNAFITSTCLLEKYKNAHQ